MGRAFFRVECSICEKTTLVNVRYVNQLSSFQQSREALTNRADNVESQLYQAIER